MQMVSLMAIAALSGLWTASDPFVGKWKLDVSRSTIVDQVVVEAAGPNKYTFRFEGGPAETIVADGTDQPGLTGTTLSVKAADSRSLKVVRKKGGRVVVLDLLSHRFEKARELYADHWLGFSEVKLHQLLDENGFEKIEVSVVAREKESPHFQTVFATGVK